MQGNVVGMQLDTAGVVVATRINDCVVVTAPSDLGRGHMAELEGVALRSITSQKTNAVIFELSGVQFMDSQEFEEFRAVTRMVQHLGVKPVLVGLRPGIIAHLVQTDVDISGLSAALGLNDALAMLER
jgi:rsbT antagonist protein RsbS